MVWRRAADQVYSHEIEPYVESTLMSFSGWFTGMLDHWMSHFDPGIKPINDLKANVAGGNATTRAAQGSKTWNDEKTFVNGTKDGGSLHDFYITQHASGQIAPIPTSAAIRAGIQAPADWAGIYLAAALGLSSNRVTAILLLFLRGAEAVTCNHCKDTISGCPGYRPGSLAPANFR